jgi:hypothetical protein
MLILFQQNQNINRLSMKKYTSWVIGAFCAFTIASGIATTSHAADTVVTAPAGWVAVDNTSLYNAGELGVSVGTSYTTGEANKVNGKNLFHEPYTLNFNAGVFYFPYRNLGFDVNVPFYQTKGVSVDEVQAGLVFRLPLSKSTFILKNLSPYVGVDAVYNWNSEQSWAYIGKVGTEVRLNKSWGIYVEANYRNYEFKNWGQGETSLGGGLHLVF